MNKIFTKWTSKKTPPSDIELKRQFQEIECEGRRREIDAKRQGEFKVAEKHALKNRYNNILPYESSRVKIEGDDGFYINANHIEFEDYPEHSYIATQGPLKDTISDFWHMIWARHLHIIVMLAKQIELGKEKVSRYWPGVQEKSVTYGPYTITLKGKERHSGFVVRTFDLTNRDEPGVTRLVKQFHYKAWPDFGIPEQNNTLLQLIKTVRDSSDDLAPTIVHCSAGVGRTGTYCTIDVALTARAKHDVNTEIPKIIRELRTQRPGMVQSEEQYVLCFRTLNDPECDVGFPCRPSFSYGSMASTSSRE